MSATQWGMKRRDKKYKNKPEEMLIHEHRTEHSDPKAEETNTVDSLGLLAIGRIM